MIHNVKYLNRCLCHHNLFMTAKIRLWIKTWQRGYGPLPKFQLEPTRRKLSVPIRLADLNVKI